MRASIAGSIPLSSASPARTITSALTFPPAVVTDKDGNALYSGRVLLLPFIEHDNLYKQWDLSARWDSPQNLALSQTILKVFDDPSAPPETHSHYEFVTGAGAMFEPPPPGKTRSIADITDGLSNTIMVVEMRTNNPSWAAPSSIDVPII